MIKRLLRIPEGASYKILRSSLAFVVQEGKKFASSASALDYPPIFIIGPPRSGTTLLYQLLVHRFHFAYFPGIAEKFYTSPVFATEWGLKHCKPYVSDFTSTYGHVNSSMAPHEAGGIWNRWYPTEHRDGYNYTPAGYFDPKRKHIIYQTVGGIEKLLDAPFINKNVKHSVRIQSLVEIFRNALFIQMRRDSFDTAMSILRARKQNRNRLNAWWSVMPKEGFFKTARFGVEDNLTLFSRQTPPIGGKSAEKSCDSVAFAMDCVPPSSLWPVGRIGWTGNIRFTQTR